MRSRSFDTTDKFEIGRSLSQCLQTTIAAGVASFVYFLRIVVKLRKNQILFGILQKNLFPDKFALLWRRFVLKSIASLQIDSRNLGLTSIARLYLLVADWLIVGMSGLNQFQSLSSSLT